VNSRRFLVGSLIGCGVIVVFGVLLVVTLIVGVGIGAQRTQEQTKPEGEEEGASTNSPKRTEEKDEENIPVTVRVSGEQGTRYRCVHFDMGDDGEPIQEEEEGQLGSTPVEYRAVVSDSKERSYTFYASCSIPPPDQRGQIKVELLINGHVVDSGETRPDLPDQSSKASTAVEVTYMPTKGRPDPSKAK
jgi:hypothetical protein